MINPSDSFPSALIFSELDDLSFSICKQLADKKCRVKIISDYRKSWASALKENPTAGVGVFKNYSLQKERQPNYIIYLLNYFKIFEKNFAKVETREIRKLHEVADLARGTRAKIIYLLPAHQKALQLLKKANQRLGENYLQEREKPLLFFGRTIGPFVSTGGEGAIEKMIRQAVRGKEVEIPSGGAVSIASSSAAAEVVLKFLFSFGVGERATVLGPEVSLQNFFQKLSAFCGPLSGKETGARVEKTISIGRTIFVSGPTDQEVISTLLPLQKKGEEGTRRAKLLSDTKKRTAYVVFSLLLFATLPYIVLCLAAGLFAAGGLMLYRGNLSTAERLIVASSKTAVVSKRGFFVLSEIPKTQVIFGPGLAGSDILDRADDIALRTISVLQITKRLSDNFFSGKSFDIKEPSGELFLELDYINRELGFLQGEVASFRERFLGGVSLDKVLEKIELAKNKTFYLSSLAHELPWLLGEEEKKVYLVLFQNNMELRPTGGYIGSFALVTIEGGRLIDHEVQDVFSADGQLAGHVEPPAPIKKYLGEGGWFLRDSNWDPDFSVSAQRAAWFLDKEIGIKVDGVIALDLEAAKKLLDTVGEIEVKDFSKTISSKNLYQEARGEIEENFFPGSTKKASFLTAVSSALVNKITDTKTTNNFSLGGAVASGLEERNIQAFFYNGPVEKSLEGLGWDGGVGLSSCNEACYADLVGLVEANVGVNKANLYIERKAELSIVLQPGLIKRTLTISWNNTAPKGAGEKARYKVYTRVIAPPESRFSNGQKRLGGVVSGFTPDVEAVRGHKEAGTIVEAYPGETSTVSFYWASPADLSNQGGEYLLKVRKQAGTIADPWSIHINNAFKGNLASDPALSLTGPASYDYNINLARDFVSSISW